MNSEDNTNIQDDRPPILGSWRSIYLVLLLVSLLLIICFYWLTLTYNVTYE